MQHDNLWAPWRMTYLAQLDSGASEPTSARRVCFLCEAAACTIGSEEARKRHVLANDLRGQILLNRYPYTNGHLLVASGQHVADLPDLTTQARSNLMELVQLAERILYAALSPQGINIGINIGRCAGAGVPGHLHVHIVPRWSGDTNFMETIGRVRVIPQALEESYEHLSGVLADIQK